MTITTFRILILVNLVGSYAATAAGWLEYDRYPTELIELGEREYAEYPVLITWLWVAGAGLIPLQLVSLIGLYLLKNWARYTFSAFVVAWLMLALRPGITFGYALTGVLSEVALLSCGAILAVVAWPPSKDFFATKAAAN